MSGQPASCIDVLSAPPEMMTSAEGLQHNQPNPKAAAAEFISRADLPSKDHVIDLPHLGASTQVRTNEEIHGAETHYILVIHGTFSQPAKDGKAKWFHLDPNKNSDNFCNRLAVRLSDGKLGAESVWRTLPDSKLLPSGVRYPFYWDGSNTDQGRKDGAWYLARLIRHIANRDPSARVHLIAHSHGGNVALKAIEQYIERLGPEASESEWPDSVRERFREVHRTQADEMQRWRRVEGVRWWALMNPFLVVWRGQKGEKEAEELYPWGYHRAVDSFFHLGRRRKKQYLRNRRMTSPVSNALGRVVFLGTPFYCKQWASWAVLKILASFFVSIVLGFALTWLAVGIWAGCFDLDTSHDAILFLALGLTLLIFFTNLAGFFERTLFRDGNMYHSDLVPWSPAMHALVIQAGKLDEAALALSAEPAAQAFLLPLVRKATRRVGFVGFPRRPSAHARTRTWVLYYLAIFRTLLLNGALFIPRLIFWLVSKLIVRHTFSVLRQIVMGLAFGLDTANLKNAKVYVEETLVLKGGVRSIHTWDVRRLLAQADAHGLPQSWSDDFECDPGASGGSGQVGREGGQVHDGSRRGTSPGLSGCGNVLSDAANERDSEHLTPFTNLEGGRESEEVVRPDAPGGNPWLAKNGSQSVDMSLGADWMSESSSYSFLWDDDELRTRSDASFMFNKLKTRLSKMEHSPRLSEAQFARELRCICCVVEARFWEIRNQWQLTHATYYRNQEIVEAIVRFLNALEVPEAKT